jgi:hypothetical protein
VQWLKIETSQNHFFDIFKRAKIKLSANVKQIPAVMPELKNQGNRKKQNR